MGGFFGFFAKLLTGDVLGRAFDVVDKKIESETDREKIKGDIIKTHYQTRGAWMEAGGFFLMLAFALPLAFWFGSVVVYSVFWCETCMYPKPWVIAALPAPLDQWAGIIIVSIFGVVGVTKLKR